MYFLRLICCVIPALNAPQPKDDVSVAGVLQQLADSSAQIRSLSVTYVSGDMSRKDSDLSAGTHLRREIACARPGFYMHWSFHPHDALTWEDDPLQQRLYINETTWYNVNPVKNIFNTGSLKTDEQLPGSAPYEFLFFATGVWPLDRPAPLFNDVPVYVHELPHLSDSFQRLDDELVNGISCVVLSRPRVDRIWADRKRPGVLIAREFFEKDSGELLQRFELFEHEEITSGLWFPRKIRNTLYRTAQDSSVTEPRESLIQISSIRVDQDEADRFVWSPPPGALNVNSTAAPKQVMPGGIEQLDRVLKFADNSITNDDEVNWPNLITVAAAFVASFCIAVAVPLRNRLKSSVRETEE